MIDTSAWKSFKISDLFVVSRGQRHVVGNHEDGDLPYYSASLDNNGVTDYISNPLFVDNDALVVTTFGDAFYAKGNFTASDEITILHHKKMNELSGLFIASTIRQNKWKYSFKVKAFKERVSNDSISLPATSDGEPNWNYMESYMKAVMEESEKSLENLRKADDAKHLIDVSRWGEFRVGDLFDIHPTNAYKITNSELLNDNGRNPVVANSGFNNGIVGFTNYKCNENSGVITFTDTAAKSSESFFYQTEDFVGYPHVQGMYCKLHNLNEYEGKFITTVLRSAAGKFDFITKMTRDEVKEFNIKLPITSTGEPDWQYMEDYMRKIMNKSEQIISDLQIEA
ncbi:MAG: restriction endonuclease subunit S [Lachnospiraceae bacterium]|nr:restriction endonuclease subunit S [Lachnospiraceae bacterium]